jgi:hypothetical protein
MTRTIAMHFNNDIVPAPTTSWVRFWDNNTYWNRIHEGVDRYNWTRMDYLVNTLYAGRNIVYTISGTPLWLARNTNEPHFAPWVGQGSNSLPKRGTGGTDPYGISYSNGFDEWNKFVFALTTRYQGKIKAYQIWNEPQLVDFMSPWDATNRADLAQMTRRAYNTIKSIDSNALVIAAPILPRPSSGGVTRGGRYWDALADLGWPVDRVSCHIYPEVDTGPTRWNELWTIFKNARVSYGAPSSPWITETTYNLLGSVLSEQNGYDYVNQTYTYAGGAFVFWYGWDRAGSIGGLNINYNTGAWAAMNEDVWPPVDPDPPEPPPPTPPDPEDPVEPPPTDPPEPFDPEPVVDSEIPVRHSHAKQGTFFVIT